MRESRVQARSIQCTHGSLGPMTALRRTFSAAALAATAFMAGYALPVHSARAQSAPAPALKPTTADSAAAKKAKKKPAGEPSAKSDTGAGSQTRAGGASGGKSIVALVNDEPITGFEVQQRSEMLAGGAVAEYMKKNAENRWKSIMTSSSIQNEFQEFAKKRQPKSKEELQAIQKEFVMAKRNSMMAQLTAEAKNHATSKTSKEALEELIDEKLKMQEAKRVGAVAADDEIDQIIKNIADRNKLTLDQLSKSLGGSLDPMKQRVRSTLAWNDVIRRKYGHQISVASKDVDKYVAASAASTAQDDVELQVQRVRINMPAKLNEAGIAKHISQAEELRGKFSDCKSLNALAAGATGVQVNDLGKRRASSFQEPTRSLLLSAKDNEMLPPTVNDGGVDLFAVCGRTVVKAEEDKRTQAEGELKQKEFELLSKKHLKDLRQDASIEYR